MSSSIDESPVIEIHSTNSQDDRNGLNEVDDSFPADVADFLFGEKSTGFDNVPNQDAATSTQSFVFDDCPLTVDGSSLLIMTFILHHKLSLKAAEDLIELINAYFPACHNGMTSLYKLKLMLMK